MVAGECWTSLTQEGSTAGTAVGEGPAAWDGADQTGGTPGAKETAGEGAATTNPSDLAPHSSHNLSIQFQKFSI